MLAWGGKKDPPGGKNPEDFPIDNPGGKQSNGVNPRPGSPVQFQFAKKVCIKFYSLLLFPLRSSKFCLSPILEFRRSLGEFFLAAKERGNFILISIYEKMGLFLTSPRNFEPKLISYKDCAKLIGEKISVFFYLDRFYSIFERSFKRRLAICFFI